MSLKKMVLLTFKENNKKTNIELTCGGKEVCKALALLTRFYFFFLCIKKKDKCLCRLFTTSHVG